MKKATVLVLLVVGMLLFRHLRRDERSEPSDNENQVGADV